MKKWVVFFLTMMCCGVSVAQQFQKKLEIALPDSVQEAQVVWVDLDNDGLLDILIAGKVNATRSYLYFIKGDTVNTPELSTAITSILNHQRIEITDYDLDNDIDVVVSGKRNGIDTTAVYLNMGSFQFEEHLLNVPAFTKSLFADLDNDARSEWIVSGVHNGLPYTRILKQQQNYLWRVVHDSLKFQLSALEVIDANGDGRFDLFISGKVRPDSVVSGFLINQNSFYFQPKNSIEFQGTSSTGDMNADGKFDVMVSGKDSMNADRTMLYQSVSGDYSVSTVEPALKDGVTFLADLNSDGIVDVNYVGKNSLGDTLNIINYGDQDYDTLNSSGLIVQHFGDVEHDGDLDLLQLVQRDSLYIVLYENSPNQKNVGPNRPLSAIVLPIFNRFFAYWDKPTDDHTPIQSLTFDLFVNGAANYQAGSFDLLNEKRLSVTHGNNGTQNFRLLKGLPVGDLSVAIQAIDNAFHTGANSICIGSGGGGGNNCATAMTKVNKVKACHHENVVLQSSQEALWFSFTDGFVVSASEFSFQANMLDTIFSFSPHLITSGCDALKVWIIEINDDTIKTELATRFVCVGAKLNFEVEPDWETIIWKSDLKGNLGATESIVYTATENDTVSVTLKNNYGCSIQRKTAIRISRPNVVLVADQYKIVKGGSVTLGATGAERYLWTPASFLNQNNIPNPTATPINTIQYTVTGYDSINCSSQKVVTVSVEDSGFVPTLFTPNDDGQNDALKIYGLATAKEFLFAIYNREGSLVFNTSDVTEAVQRGWDGTVNGKQQPGGVYFWKVKGSLTTGRKVLLNGKESGSIVLIR